MDKLRELLKSKMANASAILEKADTESNGLLSEAEQKIFSTLETEIHDIKKQITARESFEKLEGSLTESAGRTVPPVVSGEITVGKDRIEDDPEGGFSSLGDLALAVRAACMPGGFVNDKLRPLAAASDAAKLSGGDETFGIPPAHRERIWEVVLEQPDVFNLMQPEPTSKNSIEIVKDQSTPWGSVGIQAYWGSEGAQMTASDLETKGSVEKLSELYVLTHATEDLLDDEPRLTDRLTNKSGKAISYKASDAFVNGNGVGKPLGVLNSGSLVEVAKDTSQAADTISSTNLANMYSQLIESQNGFWLCSSGVLAAIIDLNNSGQMVWTSNNEGFKLRPQGQLLGQPLYKVNHCQVIGDKGDIYFINPDGYAAFSKGGPKYAESIHLYFDYALKSFRWIFKVAGMPYMNAAVTQANSNLSESYFITLAARA